MIEVLKQALEALEKSLPRLAPYGEQDWLDSKAAITSLRQAIAEAEKQEGQSNFCAQCEALSRELKAIKQEQGEPVGYLEIDDIESQREYPHNCRNVNLWYESGEGLVAVYTHPPQRKPLTDEQILNVARDHYNPHQRPEISFARAIEAAHGIKE